MPLDLLRRVLSELPHCGLAQGYGMTELSGNAVFLSPEDHRRAAADEPELLAAAGRPGPLVGLRIVDDDDQDVAAGRRRRDPGPRRPGLRRVLERSRGHRMPHGSARGCAPATSAGSSTACSTSWTARRT